MASFGFDADWINLHNLSKDQLGLFLECAFAAAVERSPGIIDPRRPDFLGTKKQIVGIMSEAIGIVHLAVKAGFHSNPGTIPLPSSTSGGFATVCLRLQAVARLSPPPEESLLSFTRGSRGSELQPR